MAFDPAKTKKLYQNGISHIQENVISKAIIDSFDEWSILAPTGDLIGFIKLDSGSELPPEIWIRDKKYKLSEKIHRNNS